MPGGATDDWQRIAPCANL